MSYFAQLGKKLNDSAAVLTSSTLSATMVTAVSDEWTDVYHVFIATDDTANRTVTISDGTKTLTYYVGGSAAASHLVDAATVPYRFAKGANITATASGVTTSLHISVQLRALTSKT